MGHDGSRLPPSWGLWLALLLWGLLLLYLLAPILPARGQELLESSSSELQLRLLLRKADEALTLSEQALAERSRQANELQDSLQKAALSLAEWKSAAASWKASWEKSQASLSDLQRALSEMQSSYDELMRRFVTLSVSWVDYQKEMRSQVQLLERQRTVWQVLAGILAAAAAALGTWAAVK